jgi:hypothetical protein
LFTTLVAASISAPLFNAKDTGLVPVFLVPIDLDRLDPITKGVISIAVMWGVLYVFSLVVAVIAHFVLGEKLVEKPKNPASQE